MMKHQHRVKTKRKKGSKRNKWGQQQPSEVTIASEAVVSSQWTSCSRHLGIPKPPSNKMHPLLVFEAETLYPPANHACRMQGYVTTVFPRETVCLFIVFPKKIPCAVVAAIKGAVSSSKRFVLNRKQAGQSRERTEGERGVNHIFSSFKLKAKQDFGRKMALRTTLLLVVTLGVVWQGVYAFIRSLVFCLNFFLLCLHVSVCVPSF